MSALTIVLAPTEKGTDLRGTAEAALAAASALRVEMELIVPVSAAEEETARHSLHGLPCRFLLSDEPRAVRLNAGAAAAEGALLLFMEDGVVLTAEGLEQLLTVLLSDEDIAAVGPFSNRTVFSWQYMNAEEMAADGVDAVVWAARHLTHATDSLFLEDFALLMRRSTFLQAGGFDASFADGGADLDLSFRLRYAGARLLRVPTYLAHRGAEVCDLYDLTRTVVRPLLMQRWGLDIGVPETIWQEALGTVSWANDLPLIRASARSALLRTPLVSILIPVCGGMEHLRETVDSARAQTYPNVEIVLVHTGADVRAQEILGGYADDLRVRCVCCGEAEMPSLQACIRHAQGEYIQCCTVGDVLLPDRLTQMMDAFLSHPKTSFVTALCGQLDAAGAFVGLSEETAPVQGFSVTLDGAAVGRELLRRQVNPLGTLPCALFRRQDFVRWLDGCRCEDGMEVDLWLYLLERGDVVVVNRPLRLMRGGTAADAERHVRCAVAWRKRIAAYWRRRVFLTEETDERAARAYLAERIAPLLPHVSAELRQRYEAEVPDIYILLMNRVEECAPIRLDAPLSRLAARGQVALHGCLKKGDPFLELDDLSALHDTIILLERAALTDSPALRHILAASAAQGNVLLQEMDDHPQISEKEVESDCFLFRAVSAVQTSTKYLADFLRTLNPYVYLFENQLTELPEPRAYDRESPRVTIFFGALNRRADWEEIMPALRRAIHRHGDRLYFRVVSDRDFYDALDTQAKAFTGGRDGSVVAPYEHYTAALAASDIALLPLRDTAFNRAKSDLKFIEAAGHGAAVLASPTVYAGSVRDGETGMIYRSMEEFAAKLDLLIERADLRRTLAENAYRYVAQHRLLAQHLDDYTAAYREMLARREEFERERCARVEQYFPHRS